MGANQSSAVKFEAELKIESVDSSDSSWEDIEDDDDDEELYLERLRILAETGKMRQMAEFFLHPEAPVQVGCCACARCYFDRPSAPTRLSLDQANQMAAVLEDAKALKQLAVHYAHLERPVETTDPTACARCYFDRSSAPVAVATDEVEEKASILEENRLLGIHARDFLHPERPVVTSDRYAFGRNYFHRFSTAFCDYCDEEDLERAKILQEAAALSAKALDFVHPERAVTTTDPYACGRNYYCRFSAPDSESFEDAQERAKIVEEAKALKTKSVEIRHPDLPISPSNPFACGRNYFCRPSALVTEDPVLSEERALIMKDLAQLRRLAVDNYHPELPAVTTDPTACARNYFCRPSVPIDELDGARDASERCGDLYFNHAPFDLDDEVHAHHVEFDKNPYHHAAISEAREVPYGIIVGEPHLEHLGPDGEKLARSPECIMFFAKTRSHAV